MLDRGNKNTDAKMTFQDPISYNFQIYMFQVLVEHSDMNKKNTAN